MGDVAAADPDVELLISAGREHGDACSKDVGPVVVGDPHGGREQRRVDEGAVRDYAVDFPGVFGFGGFRDRYGDALDRAVCEWYPEEVAGLDVYAVGYGVGVSSESVFV